MAKKAKKKKVKKTAKGPSIADLQAKLEASEAKAAKATAELAEVQGMSVPNVKKKDRKIPRPDEIMARDLASAVGVPTDELSDEQRIAIERNIRKYVKRGYIVRDGERIEVGPKGQPLRGYKAGIPPEDKARADALLRKIGRVDKNGKVIVLWDESIVVPGF